MDVVRRRSTRSAEAAVAVTVGLAGSAALAWQGSRGAFCGITSNSGNNWRSGTVALSDNRGAAMFDTAAQLIRMNRTSAVYRRRTAGMSPRA